MTSTDTQQARTAELRQAFLRHLPNRLETLSKRLHKLANGAWDINALSLIYDDLQSLTSGCGTYGKVKLSEQLLGIEVYLSSLIESAIIPSKDQRQSLLDMVNGLDVPPAQTSEDKPIADPHPDASRASAERAELSQGPARADMNLSETATGFVTDFILNHCRPPAEFLPTPSTVLAAPTTPSATATPIPSTRATALPGHRAALYYFRDDDAAAQALTDALRQRDFEVSVFDDLSEGLEMLSAITPDAVMVGTAYLTAIDEIGAQVKKIRERQQARLPLLAFAVEHSLESRLQTLRAGADAFLLDSTPIAEVLDRLDELVDSRSDDPYRILIVDDEQAQAMFAASVLEKAGMRCQTLLEPLQVIDALDRFEPELILMDYHMPAINGAELTAVIRERDAHVSTPIVFLSGEQDAEKQFDAISLGGDDFLSKPIRPRHLISAVTNRVRRARSLTKRASTERANDAITGLVERAKLIDEITATMSKGGAGGVAIAQLTNPLRYRERLGLDGFESLIEQLGTLMVGSLGDQGCVAKYGDAAFAILCKGLVAEQLSELMEGLANILADEELTIKDQTVLAAVTIGVCPFHRRVTDVGGMLTAAERAAQLAEQQVDSRVKLHRPVAGAGGQNDLAGQIERALADDDFYIVYQPVVPIGASDCERYQALLRLHGDDGRTLVAADFLPVAEAKQQLADIDRWVLSQALTVLEKSHAEGRKTDLFINQSLESLQDEKRLAWLAESMQARRLRNGTGLNLEYRLSDIANGLTAAVNQFANLQIMNISVCVAHFDNSAVAWQLLDRLPVTYVKMVPSALEDLDGLRETVKKLQSKRFRVIVPGVENAQSAAKAWQSGADFLQGNFVQQPDASRAYDFEEAML